MEDSGHLTGPSPSGRRTVKYWNLIFPVVLILCVTMFAWFSRSSEIGFDWSEEAVSITDPGGEVFTIRYADVTSLTLETRSDFGRCLSGESRRNWTYGIWENGDWGTYRLLAAAGVDRCIVFQTAQMCYVLSYESDRTTEALYEQLLPIVDRARSGVAADPSLQQDSAAMGR